MRTFGKGSLASIIGAALAVLWIVLWIAGAVVLAFAVPYALKQAGVSLPAVVTNSSEELFDMPWQTGVPALLAGLVVIGGSLIILQHLRRLFDSFTSGDPFRRENANHLRAIWITMLIMELLRQALFAVTATLVAAAGIDAAEIHVRIDLPTWVAIFVLIAIAEAFREGARLKEEQELTI